MACEMGDCPILLSALLLLTLTWTTFCAEYQNDTDNGLFRLADSSDNYNVEIKYLVSKQSQASSCLDFQGGGSRGQSHLHLPKQLHEQQH